MKLDLILENVRNKYNLGLLEESEGMSERDLLKGKIMITEATMDIRKMLVEEGTIVAVQSLLQENWEDALAGAQAAVAPEEEGMGAGTVAAGLGALGVGAAGLAVKNNAGYKTANNAIDTNGMGLGKGHVANPTMMDKIGAYAGNKMNDGRAVGQAVSAGAQTAGQAVVNGAQTAGQAVVNGAQTAGQAVVNAPVSQSIINGAQTAGQAVAKVPVNTVGLLANGAGKVSTLANGINSKLSSVRTGMINAAK
jgi:hypothetical protein